MKGIARAIFGILTIFLFFYLTLFQAESDDDLKKISQSIFEIRKRSQREK